MLNLTIPFGRLLQKGGWWALRPRRSVLIAGSAFICLLISLLHSNIAKAATPPALPTITEPYIEGKIVYPGDVHMEAGGFADSDGDTHACSDWEIRPASSITAVWQAPCAAGPAKVHIHLGDGHFVNEYLGRTELEFNKGYVLRVRFIDTATEASGWAERSFSTDEASPPGVPSDTPFAIASGFNLELVGTDFQLPVNIAFVPHPGSNPKDPLFYVTEILGIVKLVTRDGTTSIYVNNLLNFNPSGAGDEGLAGIVVDPESGDLFVDMATANPANLAEHHAMVVRLHSEDGGRTAATRTTILDMVGELQGGSHQVSNLTIGPDNKLYLHNGDGFFINTGQDLNSFRGKILRLNLDGSPAVDNPFYNASDGISATDYIFAYGFRNPFGGDWRALDSSHYEVETGPNVDRLAKVVAGRNYLYDGSDASMRQYAAYVWEPPDHAPVNIAFIQPETQGASGFPSSKWDHAFVSEAGSFYATGPSQPSHGKRIVEIALTPEGALASGATPFVEYTGNGKASIIGLAAGPDGLYFSDFYKDIGATSPADPGARIWRIRYVGSNGGKTGVQPLGNLVPDWNLESDPSLFYASAGAAVFSWGTDSAINTNALKIVSNSTGLNRWMTQTKTISVTPGKTYNVSAFFKTQAVNSGEAHLTVTYWNSAGSYLGYSYDSVQQVTSTQDWTQLNLQTIAPSGAAYVRPEFRLNGIGTLWIDDVAVTTDQPTSTPPANTSLPIISGTPQSGQTLTASPGNWSGNPAPSFSYQWQRCLSGTCTDIAGATFLSYAASSSDIGKTLRVKVTGVNSAGSSTIFSNETSVVINVPPPASTNNLAPNSSFESDPNVNYYTYTAGGANFGWTTDAVHSGNSSLKITSPDTVLARWLSQTYSIPVTPGKAYDVSGWVKTTGGTAILTVTLWNQNTGFTGASYSSSPVGGNTDWTQLSTSFTAPSNATHARLEFRYTGPGSAWMDDVNLSDQSSSSIPTPPTNTLLPIISGTPQSGQTLSASSGNWSGNPAPSFNYQWQNCAAGTCSDIAGAASQIYAAISSDVGKTLRVKVTATNSAGSISVFSAETLAVADAPPIVVNNLAPNSSFESDPSVDYYNHGSGIFSWATDSTHIGSRSLKIVSTSSSLTRWLSQTYRIPATANKIYSASAWLKTANASGGNLTLTFWGSSGYLGTAYSSQIVNGTQDWTQLQVQGQAPVGTTAVRLEFRLGGAGTAWFDDATLTEK